ncbi:MAG: BlaI/MecI/CopY family transcriptional regulator [Streptosporangiaceae bacterium]
MGGEGSRPASGSPPGVERRAAGALEAEILAILREADGPLSPGEVRQRLGPRLAPGQQADGQQAPGQQADGQQAVGRQPGAQRGELSYSTVVTIVTRLHAKGLLARQRAGRGFTYTAVDDASLAASRMRQALGSEHDHDAVLSRFVSGLSGRDARLLRQLLAGDTGTADGDPGHAGEQG